MPSEPNPSKLNTLLWPCFIIPVSAVRTPFGRYDASAPHRPRHGQLRHHCVSRRRRRRQAQGEISSASRAKASAVGRYRRDSELKQICDTGWIWDQGHADNALSVANGDRRPSYAGRKVTLKSHLNAVRPKRDKPGKNATAIRRSDKFEGESTNLKEQWNQQQCEEHTRNSKCGQAVFEIASIGQRTSYGHPLVDA